MTLQGNNGLDSALKAEAALLGVTIYSGLVLHAVTSVALDKVFLLVCKNIRSRGSSLGTGYCVFKVSWVAFRLVQYLQPPLGTDLVRDCEALPKSWLAEEQIRQGPRAECDRAR